MKFLNKKPQKTTADIIFKFIKIPHRVVNGWLQMAIITNAEQMSTQRQREKGRETKVH